MVFGKIPPQARELEEAVLGAILLEKNAFDVAADILKPEAFYSDANQKIFRAMVSMANKSMPIDLLTLVEELKNLEYLDQVGGPYYISKLTNAVVSTANIEVHARIVWQKYLSRELIRIGGEMMGNAYEDSNDIFNQLDEVDGKITELTTGSTKGNYSKLDSVIAKNIVRIEDLKAQGKEITGIPSGFYDIDRILTLSSLQPGHQ
jgi:replicative DNA helicase